MINSSMSTSRKTTAFIFDALIDKMIKIYWADANYLYCLAFSFSLDMNDY